MQFTCSVPFSRFAELKKLVDDAEKQRGWEDDRSDLVLLRAQVVPEVLGSCAAIHLFPAENEQTDQGASSAGIYLNQEILNMTTQS